MTGCHFKASFLCRSLPKAHILRQEAPKMWHQQWHIYRQAQDAGTCLTEPDRDLLINIIEWFLHNLSSLGTAATSIAPVLQRMKVISCYPLLSWASPSFPWTWGIHPFRAQTHCHEGRRQSEEGSGRGLHPFLGKWAMAPMSVSILGFTPSLTSSSLTNFPLISSFLLWLPCRSSGPEQRKTCWWAMRLLAAGAAHAAHREPMSVGSGNTHTTAHLPNVTVTETECLLPYPLSHHASVHDD